MNDYNMHGLLSKEEKTPDSPNQLSLISLTFWAGQGKALDIMTTTKTYNNDIDQMTRRIKTEYMKWLPRTNNTSKNTGIFNNLPRIINAGQIGLQTSHSTFLCFDLLTETMSSQPKQTILNSNQFHPINLRIYGDYAEFFLNFPGLELILFLDIQTNLVQLKNNSNEPTNRFRIEKHDSGKFSFQFKTHYLCAEKNGSVICNRKIADEWERFEVTLLKEN